MPRRVSSCVALAAIGGVTLAFPAALAPESQHDDLGADADRSIKTRSPLVTGSGHNDEGAASISKTTSPRSAASSAPRNKPFGLFGEVADAEPAASTTLAPSGLTQRINTGDIVKSFLPQSPRQERKKNKSGGTAATEALQGSRGSGAPAGVARKGPRAPASGLVTGIGIQSTTVSTGSTASTPGSTASTSGSTASTSGEPIQHTTDSPSVRPAQTQDPPGISAEVSSRPTGTAFPGAGTDHGHHGKLHDETAIGIGTISTSTSEAPAEEEPEEPTSAVPPAPVAASRPIEATGPQQQHLPPLPFVDEDHDGVDDLAVSDDSWWMLLPALLGVAYVIAWTLVFWPQIVENYRRKSSKALSVGFHLYNLLGFLCYSVYTVASRVIQDVHNLPQAVTVHDAAFSLHGMFCCLVLTTQIILYSSSSSVEASGSGISASAITQNASPGGTRIEDCEGGRGSGEPCSTSSSSSSAASASGSVEVEMTDLVVRRDADSPTFLWSDRAGRSEASTPKAYTGPTSAAGETDSPASTAAALAITSPGGNSYRGGRAKSSVNMPGSSPPLPDQKVDSKVKKFGGATGIVTQKEQSWRKPSRTNNEMKQKSRPSSEMQNAVGAGGNEDDVDPRFGKKRHGLYRQDVVLLCVLCSVLFVGLILALSKQIPWFSLHAGRAGQNMPFASNTDALDGLEFGDNAELSEDALERIDAEEAFRSHSSYWSLLTLLGFIKVVITAVKYPSQILLNCQRRSTAGLAKTTYLLDLTGGCCSVLQNLVLAWLKHDREILFANLPKLIIGGLACGYDLVILSQFHIYDRSKRVRGRRYEPVAVEEGRHQVWSPSRASSHGSPTTVVGAALQLPEEMEISGLARGSNV